jgi:hypothetical protein
MRVRIANRGANRVAVGRNIAAVMTFVIANGLAMLILAEVNLADGLVIVFAVFVAFIALDVFELVHELQDVKFEFIEAAGFEVLAAGIEVLTVFALVDIDLMRVADAGEAERQATKPKTKRCELDRLKHCGIPFKRKIVRGC